MVCIWQILVLGPLSMNDSQNGLLEIGGLEDGLKKRWIGDGEIGTCWRLKTWYIEGLGPNFVIW